MKQMEVFFDYACPYCMRAHGYLVELLPSYPELEIVWRPCESHPRPDRYGPHSDLMIRGMFWAQAQGVDLMAYHAHMYDAALQRHVDVEDIDALANSARHFLDADAFGAVLKASAYKGELDEANAYAYDRCGVWVVPAYRLGGKKLDVVEDVGVSKKQLKQFIERNK